MELAFYREAREPVMPTALDLHSNGFERPHSFVAHPAVGEDEVGIDIGGEVSARGGSGSGSASPRTFSGELSSSVVVHALPVHPLLLPAPDEGGNLGHVRTAVEGGGSDCIVSGRATAQVKYPCVMYPCVGFSDVVAMCRIMRLCIIEFVAHTFELHL
jgi:hypothetical protein